METEYEVRILDIDVEQIKKKLAEVGAKKIADRKMRRHVYDLTPELGYKGYAKWIRLRDMGDKVTLTIKEITEDKIDGTKESEIEVSNFEDAHKLLQHMGHKSRQYQENKRISYILDGVEIEIDSWPMIPTFLEIEGKSKEDVERVVKLLGFTMDQTTSTRVRGIYGHYGYDIHKDYNKLKFD